MESSVRVQALVGAAQRIEQRQTLLSVEQLIFELDHKSLALLILWCVAIERCRERARRLLRKLAPICGGVEARVPFPDRSYLLAES